MKVRFITGAIVALVPTILLAAAPITQGYLSQSQLSPGELVSAAHNPGVVEPANTDNQNNLVGVVGENNGGVFEVTSGAGEFQVASSGTVPALVSDINGAIKVGDRITSSAINGVGQKASGSGRVVGIAQQSFDGKGGGATKISVIDSKGKKQSADLGRIEILVGVSYYTAGPSITDVRGVLASFQTVAQRLTGRAVSTTALVLASIAIIIALTSGIIIMASAVHGTLVAMGRNPTAQQYVMRGLFGSISIGVLTIAAGCGVAYLAIRFL